MYSNINYFNDFLFKIVENFKLFTFTSVLGNF